MFQLMEWIAQLNLNYPRGSMSQYRHKQVNGFEGPDKKCIMEESELPTTSTKMKVKRIFKVRTINYNL